MFLYKSIYVYKIVCAQLFNIYFIEYLYQCILYKNDRLPTLKNTFSNKGDLGVSDVARSLPQKSAPEPPNFDRCEMPTSTFMPILDSGFKTSISMAF